MRRGEQWAVVGLCAAILLSVPVGSLFRLGAATAESELRALAPPPSGPLAAWPDQASEWLRDRLAYRLWIIRARARLLYEAGIVQSEKVVLGREGWLFYRAGGMREYEEAPPFSAAELNALRSEVQTRHQWLAQKGARYLIVIAPNKASIYPEYLPDWMAYRPVRLDQLTEDMRARGLPWLDLRDVLRGHAHEYQLYYPTGTHWTTTGAYLAHQAICQALGISLAECGPVQTSRQTADQRDLARMIGAQGIGQPVSETSLTAATPEEVLCPDWLRHLKWTARPSRAFYCPTAPEGTLLVIHDSFMPYMMPFLSSHFRHSIYIWARDVDREVIARIQPTVVIHEVVERRLHQHPWRRASDRQSARAGLPASPR